MERGRKKTGSRSVRQPAAIADDGTFGLPQSMPVDVSVLAAGVGDRQAHIHAHNTEL
jgi:hypothetical protein